MTELEQLVLKAKKYHYLIFSTFTFELVLCLIILENNVYYPSVFLLVLVVTFTIWLHVYNLRLRQTKDFLIYKNELPASPTLSEVVMIVVTFVSLFIFGAYGMERLISIEEGAWIAVIRFYVGMMSYTATFYYETVSMGNLE